MIFLYVNLIISCCILSAYAEQIALGNSQITWRNKGNETDFIMISSLTDDFSPYFAWFAVGINYYQQMSGANVFLCRNYNNSDSSIQHFFNNGYYSTQLDSINPSIGLSRTNISVIDGKLVCSFTRANDNPNPRYYKIDEFIRVYVLVAYGPGDLSYHFLNKALSTNTMGFSLPRVETTTSRPTISLITSRNFTQATSLMPNFSVPFTQITLTNSTMTTASTTSAILPIRTIWQTILDQIYSFLNSLSSFFKSIFGNNSK